MGNFRGGNQSRGRDDRGDRGDRQMHSATCADCGKRCEVPFRPTGDKPVYCSNCFNQGDSPSRGGGGFSKKGGGFNKGGNRGGGFDRGDREMHKATCDDCGRRCEVPFRPSGDKPIFCSDCFGKGDGAGKRENFSKKGGFNKGDDSGSKQAEVLAKLDKILFLLQRADPVKEVTVMKPKKKVKKEEVLEEAPKKVAKKKPAKKAAPKKKTTKKPAKKKVAKKKAK
jgi:CxxC-x17-CxxC domain-containing protein